MPSPTVCLPVDPLAPQPEVIDRAAQVLRRGGLVAVPTETVYGLAAGALLGQAVERIFTAKGRPATNPLIVHVRSIAEAQSLAAEWPAAAEQLAAAFWPGALTLVLPRREVLPSIVTAGGPTVALRMPSHPVMQAVMHTADMPLAAPSANRSMHVSATTAQHVLRWLDGRIDLVLDAGQTPGGLESTVLDLSGAAPRLLRPGLIAPDRLEQVLRQPIAIAQIHASSQVGPLLSPGTMSRHYAPQVPLECYPPAEAAERVSALLAAGQRVGWLSLGERAASTATAAATHETDRLVQRTMPSSASAYAAELYAALHEQDAAGVARIVVSLPPEGPAWLAVHDRLRRAAAAE